MGGNLQIMGRIIIIRSPFYVTGGVKSERLVFHKPAEKGLPKKMYCVVLFHVFWVGRSTGTRL